MPTRCALGDGAGPGDEPLTIDLASTVCETYGLCKEGTQRHNYAGQRGYHPLLAIAAGTGDVLMARLRKGRANTARGAANFLRETISRVRYAGATGPLTMRADSGFLHSPHCARLPQIGVSASPPLNPALPAGLSANSTSAPREAIGTAGVATSATAIRHEPGDGGAGAFGDDAGDGATMVTGLRSAGSPQATQRPWSRAGHGLVVPWVLRMSSVGSWGIRRSLRMS